MKLINKITFIIILFLNINAFGAISYVDDIDDPEYGLYVEISNVN